MFCEEACLIMIFNEGTSGADLAGSIAAVATIFNEDFEGRRGASFGTNLGSSSTYSNEKLGGCSS